MTQLDKTAHAVAQARATGEFDHLKPQEDAFVEFLLDLAPDLDQHAVGAAWLILGQLIATGMAQHPEHLQPLAVGNLLNAARLAGQRLYSGAPLAQPCPILRSNGTGCRFTAKGARQDVLDAMMRAHVDVYHPGTPWVAREEQQWDPNHRPLTVQDMRDQLAADGA